MDLWDRLLWLGIGCFIGFVLGYMVRTLQLIKEKVDHVDEVVTEETDQSKWDRNQSGFMRNPILADLAMLLVATITAYAAFSAARVNHDLKQTLVCITNYNTHEGRAIRHRDKSVEAVTKSEIRLWTEYGKLYALAKADPSKIPAAQATLNQAIALHREALIETQAARDTYPYPDANVLKSCKETSHE